MRLAFLAALLLILIPVSAQQERRPYFSLSTNRTFGPGETPTVQLWTQNVDSLEFRVYKVRDPIEFFRKQEDVHRHQGDGEPEVSEPTLIEQFHSLKRRLRTRLVNSVRAQYSPESRSLIRARLVPPPPTAPPARASQYATLPLLNSQQVVAVWRQPAAQGRRWESATVQIPVADKGLYLVEAAHEDLRAYTVAIISDLVLLTKTSPGRIQALTLDRQTGTPVSGVPVLFWAAKQEHARLVSDTQGAVETDFQAEANSATVLARHGDDFAIASLYSWLFRDQSAQRAVGLVYTDRPVYRPGHTVEWKAILRSREEGGFLLPGGQVRIEIADPDGQTVHRQEAAISAMGTVNGRWTIPSDAALGYFSIQVHADGAEHTSGFHVEEYRKPEYQVRVTPSTRRVLQGERVPVEIAARYFFGEPVARAKVTYAVYRGRYWTWMLSGEEPEEDEENLYDQEQVAEGTGELDADGKLTVTIDALARDEAIDLRYRVEARVMDAANREIAGGGSVLATRGSFFLNARPERYVAEAGQQAGFVVTALDYDGKPVETAVRGELLTDRQIASAEGRTDSTGKGRLTFSVARPGSYRMRATATTPEGRTVETTTWLWITGPGLSWDTSRGTGVEIVPDRPSYQPGDTAKVLVVTGQPAARLLVTAERERVFFERVLETTEPAVTLEIPIAAAYTPNVFVTVAFIRDGKLFHGTKNLRVPAAGRQLQVDVQPAKPQYQPGEEAVYTVTARDSQGRPVAAEVSLGVVDEAIYSIRPDRTPDLFKHFYANVWNRVGTQSSLNFYFHGQAGRRQMELAGLRPRALAQLKPEMLLEPRVRKAFPDTAYWVASLQTDAQGKATARFRFPDSLTTWRATARAVTRRTDVGSALEKTIVRKNLMLRLSSPRFFTKGDEVTISALVHNYLASAKTARISLEMAGLELISGETTDVEVPAGGDARVDFRVRAARAGEAKLLGKALTDEESDALEIVLPVNPFGVKLSDARSGSLTEASGDEDLTLSFPPDSDPESRTLEVRVSPSVAGAVLGAVEYLSTYPYGCTEQTMSSFAPNVLVTRVMKELNVPVRIDQAELNRRVRAGLARLGDLQHDDGGWGWWESDDSSPFMTAYVVAGLAEARAAGYAVRGDAIARGAEWLKQAIAGPDLAPDQRAQMAQAIVLAGQGSAEILNAVAAGEAKLTPYGVAVLGLAYLRSGDPRAAGLAARLEREAIVDPVEAHWKVERDSILDTGADASAEATAYALKFLTQVRPDSPLLEKAAQWLVAHRNEGAYWSSTKQTAFVIGGLMEYVKISGELRPDFTASVEINGKQVLTKRFAPADSLATDTPVIRVPAADLAGPVRIRVTKNGSGKLYWSARTTYFSEEPRDAYSDGLTISRQYFRLAPRRDGDRIVHDLEPLAGAVRPGDALAVRLTVRGGERRYLLIEDPIPAGLEFIRNDAAYDLAERPPWWQAFWTRREYRDDRAALFERDFYRGQAEYFYVLKAVNPGNYRMSPARVEPMYDPRKMAASAPAALEVQ
ncbi:MAG: alpha-2-macroglobulin [Bryobacterales bacterium]|nr:alpha-2-macroglobulin [Bryobacterales bacterium]